jgi:two-component system, chemotaxis family, chemotaxis protein CheY
VRCLSAAVCVSWHSQALAGYEAMVQVSNILVVDDFEPMRRALKDVFADFTHLNIVEANDAGTALQLLKSGDFAALITDWHMHGAMTGLQLVRKVRADERLARLPILMLTGQSGRAQMVTAMEAGVTAYLVKPFAAAELREKLNAMLSSTSAA